jgi:hypothetical protein
MRVRLLFIPVAILVFLVSCSSSSDERVEDALKSMVVRYNNALMVAYKDGDFTSLVEVAEGNALSIPDNTYNAYLDGMGMVMDSELLGVEFIEVVRGSPMDAPKIEVVWYEEEREWREEYTFKEPSVETKERWRYRWVDKKTGEVIYPARVVDYRMLYILGEEEGKWVVKSSEIKEDKLIEEEEGTGKKRRGTFFH